MKPRYLHSIGVVLTIFFCTPLPVLSADITIKNQLSNQTPPSLQSNNLVATPISCSPSGSYFNWAALNKVTPVKNFMPVKDFMYCPGAGSAMAITAAYGSSALIQKNAYYSASDQYIMDCSGLISFCKSAWIGSALAFVTKTGLAHESVAPYLGRESTCTNPPTPLKIAAWGNVSPSNAIPNIADIKKALCAHGPVIATIYADSIFMAYKTGIINIRMQPDQFNHVVLIVGFDDSKLAWRIQNFMGTGWGENGYGWIHYGSNNIGLYSYWLQAAVQ